jgi:hypothetical protein
MATEQPAPRKKQPKPRDRHFFIEDSLLQQRCHTIRQHLINELSAFTAFDPGIDNTFVSDWQASIEACETHPTDEMLGSQLAVYTAEVDKAREACFSKAGELEFFVKKAFPKNESVLREFGFTERKKAKAKLHTVMWVKVMRLLAVNVYAAELAAVLMPGGLPGDLQTAENTLADKEVAQELFKRNIIRQTRLRIQKLNALHAFVVTVHGAAQSVFAGDKERRELFNLT